MFGFLIKKAFWDLWDNLYRVVFINLGYLAAFGILIYLPLLTGATSGPAGAIMLLVSLLIGFGVVCVYTAAASQFTASIANYGSPGFTDFFSSFKGTYKPSLVFAAANALYVFLLWVAVPVYGALNSLVGVLAISVLFWVSVLWMLAMQMFFPVQSQLNSSFTKTVRKVGILFFDNTPFFVGLAIGSVLVTAVSFFTAFLLPGLGAVVLWLNVALKLRIYKYDYLEQNPEADRRKIPWDALLIDDRDRVGKRTLRGMIFPWKE